MTFSKTFLAITLLFLTVVQAGAAVIVVGQPADSRTGNIYPFGSNDESLYQQVCSGTQFPGPITIGGLEFYNTQASSDATRMAGGLWTISLSTTSAGWNTLSTNPSDNVGADEITVFSGSLAQPWFFGKTLEIAFSTPFTYDPAEGNLLMNVSLSGLIPGDDFIYFDTNGTLPKNNFFGRVVPLEVGGYHVDSGYGLVTGFVEGTSAVPEPGAAFLLVLGLGSLAVLRRRLRG